MTPSEAKHDPSHEAMNDIDFSWLTPVKKETGFAFLAKVIRKGTHASDMKPVWIAKGGGAISLG